ncbi:MAG: helix-turn-helix transcriptional regulator [Pseudomonadota bacterium]
MQVEMLLPRFYDCAYGGADWSETYSALTKTFHASAMLVANGSASLKPSSFEVHQVGMDDGLYAASGFAIEDNFDPIANPAFVRSLTARNGVSLSGGAYLYQGNATARRFYNDLLQPSDAVSSRIGKMIHTRAAIAGGFIARGPKQPTWSDAEIRIVDACFTHLGRALDIWVRLARATELAWGLTDVLGKSGHAILVMGPDRRILWANSKGERMLDAGIYMTSRGRRLQLPDIRHGKSLDTAISRGAGRVDLAGVGTGIRCRAEVFPATGLVGALPPSAAAGIACLILSDPMHKIGDGDEGTLIQRLGLTPAEARVAVYVPNALTKPEIAAELGLSEETVRSHVSALLNKTGARNMTALAIIVRNILD